MPARILIADDEQTFLNATADLLRRDGYEVHCACDASSAIALLHQDSFDLLIADSNMPGNPDLELINEVRRSATGLPVILVTGFPSTRTAIQAVQLAVVSYLVKPFDIAQLLALIQSSIERFAIFKSVSGAQERLRQWLQDLQAASDVLASPQYVPVSVMSENYMALTLQNILNSLQELRGLFDTLGKSSVPPTTPTQHRSDILIDALRDSINVLERTKGSFKSRELKLLREPASNKLCKILLE